MLVKNLYKNLVLHIPVVVFKIKFALKVKTELKIVNKEKPSQLFWTKRYLQFNN
jgi:hypothetical protein